MEEDDTFDDFDIPDNLELVVPQQTNVVDPFESDSDFDIEEDRIHSYLHSPVLSSNASVIASDNDETFDDIEFPINGVSWDRNSHDGDVCQDMELPSADELVARLNRVRNREYGVPHTPPLTCNPPTPIPIDAVKPRTSIQIQSPILEINLAEIEHQINDSTGSISKPVQTIFQSEVDLLDATSEDELNFTAPEIHKETLEIPKVNDKKPNIKLITLEDFKAQTPPAPKQVEPQIHRIKRQDEQKRSSYIARTPASVASSTASSRWAAPNLRETKRPPTYRVAFGRTVTETWAIRTFQKVSFGFTLVVGNMVYDPIEQTWKGNESVLQDFESKAQSKPNFIPSSGQIPTKVGNMVFDSVKMCWVGNELSKEETDLFDEIDDLHESSS
ncbi:hypothetical protein HDV01_004425 [Terramyces sp. JEL0728]|nr:hypothetical protein HDV01_004425 [Terramyces sp. JEL0728]